MRVNPHVQWFQAGATNYNQLTNENPDLETFKTVETMLLTAFTNGCYIHFWKWGDDDRKQTTIGVGGINGDADQRLQRYIAARFGAIPNWSMSYGFDLFEWVTTAQVETWGDYMHAQLGWPHLLMARTEGSFITSDNMDVNSQDNRPSSGFYADAATELAKTPTRPTLYERRFTHLRDNVWDMTTTRRALWQFAIAGGAGGYWGLSFNGTPYPNPEQLRTYRDFWQGRLLLDMAPANELTNGYGLKDGAKLCYVFYRENATSMQMNLSNMVGPQPAVAVDTRLAYAEIDLAILAPTNQTWNAPYQSDWAIAVGNFDRRAAVASDFQPELLNLSNNSYLPLITGGVATDSCGY